MDSVRLLWNDYRYFPYERSLASREVETLLGQTPQATTDGLEVPLNGKPPACYRRLTYFRQVSLPDGRELFPDQALLEASVRGPIETNPDKLARHVRSSRQSTRYSAHGLHEYRGKFNPQVVRAIGNIVGLQQGAWVLDPFCGSGTTLLECLHAGWNAVGIDVNPLAVFIANAKSQALHSSPRHLKSVYEKLSQRLEPKLASLSFEDEWTDQQMARLAGGKWAERLPCFEYLARWFPLAVLAQCSAALRAIDAARPATLRPVLQAILSDLLREASLQEPTDLRIRRRKNPPKNHPVIARFLKACETKLGNIIQARAHLSRLDGYQKAFVSDTRKPLTWLSDRLPQGFSGFDAAICSPPYVTALPYIDTQRLSLCLLGFIQERDIPRLERTLIGTRELGKSAINALEDSLLSANRDRLPASVEHLCKRMLVLAHRKGNGFRRRNVPGLVFRYFTEMRDTMSNVHQTVRAGSPFALVVGRNRTCLDGEWILIDTPKLLGDVAGQVGWKVRELIELDAYNRFDLHHKNSIRSESLLILEKA